jgi:hypothetical protein
MMPSGRVPDACLFRPRDAIPIPREVVKVKRTLSCPAATLSRCGPARPRRSFDDAGLGFLEKKGPSMRTHATATVKKGNTLRIP